MPFVKRYLVTLAAMAAVLVVSALFVGIVAGIAHLFGEAVAAWVVVALGILTLAGVFASATGGTRE